MALLITRMRETIGSRRPDETGRELPGKTAEYEQRFASRYGTANGC